MLAMNFIDNSYHLLVYKLLSFLYGCIREDYEPADDSITPEAMNIKRGYFKYIIDHLLQADYIRKHDLYPYQITPRGIQYLETHEMMVSARIFCSNKKYDRKIYNNFVD